MLTSFNLTYQLIFKNIYPCIYKKFLYILWELVGPFDIFIIFSEDESPIACQPNTEVEFSVKENGEARFSLNNIIEMRTYW